MSNPEMNVDQRPQRRPENVNTSGKGPNAPVPNAVKGKFNWGAFFLTFGLFLIRIHLRQRRPYETI